MNNDNEGTETKSRELRMRELEVKKQKLEIKLLEQKIKYWFIPNFSGGAIISLMWAMILILLIIE